MIDLPDYRQRDGHSCGPVAVRVALRALKCPASIAENLPCHPIDGTDPRSVETILRTAGLCVQAGEMEWADLLHHTRLGRPVLCLVMLEGVGHWVVVGGVRSSVVMGQCPANGPFSMRRSEWERAWSDSDRYGVVYWQFGIAVYKR